MNFTISLAGVNIEIRSIHAAVYDLCRDYLTDRSPDFSVATTPEDIAFERKKSNEEAAHEGRPAVDFPDDYLETLAVYRKICEKLLPYDAFLMHGAVVAQNGAAYLFTAPSGLGKTTHTRFWLEKYPEAFILNGDKPILRFQNGKLFACGTPWAGKEGQNRNVILPLRAVCVLFRGKENKIEPVRFDRIFPLLISQTYRPTGEAEMRKTLELIKKTGECVRFYAMFCNLDPNAARVAKEGMDQNEPN